MCSFNCLFNGKLSSVSNLIFMKPLPYSPFLPTFVVSISFLIPFESSVYFFNTSFSSSVESKTKYLLPFFSSICPSIYQLSDTKDLHCEYFTILNIFNCNVSNIVNINVFVQFFVYL